MKLTKKSVKHETKEIVCEVTQAEFDMLCAKTAAQIVTEFIGDDFDMDGVRAGLELAKVFATFIARLDDKMFDNTDTNENPDNKEEK